MNQPAFIPGQVDVLILTYNHGPWLREAIESVLAQTYQNLTITVYDDCSTDDTPALMANFAHTTPSIRYVRRKKTLANSSIPGWLMRIAKANSPPFFTGMTNGIPIT